MSTENTQRPAPDNGFTDKVGAAIFLGVRPRTIERWMARRAIPFYRIEGVVRFDLSELKESLKRFNRKETIDEIAQIGAPSENVSPKETTPAE